MLTTELKNKIDKLWETFWTGGLTNPLDVIEQITYLIFIKMLDFFFHSNYTAINKKNPPITNRISPSLRAVRFFCPFENSS